MTHRPPSPSARRKFRAGRQDSALKAQGAQPSGNDLVMQVGANQHGIDPPQRFSGGLNYGWRLPPSGKTPPRQSGIVVIDPDKSPFGAIQGQEGLPLGGGSIERHGAGDGRKPTDAANGSRSQPGRQAVSRRYPGIRRPPDGRPRGGAEQHAEIVAVLDGEGTQRLQPRPAGQGRECFRREVLDVLENDVSERGSPIDEPGVGNLQIGMTASGKAIADR